MGNSVFRKLLLPVLLLLVYQLHAQVGVGTSSPVGTLQVATAGTYEGLIPPRLTYAQLAAKTAYGTSQTGAMVYVTTNNSTTTTGALRFVGKAGLYYFDGTQWLPLSGPRIYNGTCNVGDPGNWPGTIPSTGFIVSAVKSGNTAVTYIQITHNLNITGNQFIKVSYLSNAVNDLNQYNNDDNLAEPLIVNVTANSFQVFLTEYFGPLEQNVTLQIQLVEYY